VTDREDRIVGLLLGLAAGDRIGGPVRLALRVAESLLRRGGFDLSDIATQYLDWWREGAFDTGPTAANVLTLVVSGVPFEHAAIQADTVARGLTAGCNPAHRSAPLAMCGSLADDAIAPAARAEARLTHWHPLAGDVAAAVAGLCRSLIRGQPWPDAVAAATEDRLPETRDALETGLSSTLSRGLSPSGFAPEALRAAIDFVARAPSFNAALDQAVGFAGPSNYCPVLVGSIGGARWGRRAIDDASLLHHVALMPRLTAAASALALAWPKDSSR